MKAYYKVIVINIDIFESTVADERHFASREEAEEFADSNQSANKAAVVITMV